MHHLETETIAHRSRYWLILLMTTRKRSIERLRTPIKCLEMAEKGMNEKNTVSNSSRKALFSVAGNDAIKAVRARSVAWSLEA